MKELLIKYNELSAEEFVLLWKTVWGPGPSLEQTRLAMEHTLFRVSIFDQDNIVAMARVIGDMGLNYYIKDVVVRPEYQGRGISRMLINCTVWAKTVSRGDGKNNQRFTSSFPRVMKSLLCGDMG